MSNPNRLVLADGCFDPIHVGHLRYLAAAADLSEELLVNVAPDEAIRAKGREPFQTLQERGECIERIDGVDNWCSHTLAFAIDLHRPQYLVKGVEWVGKLPADVVRMCKEAGTIIVYTDTQTRTSTERLGGDFGIWDARRDAFVQLRDMGDENDHRRENPWNWIPK